MGVGTLIIFIAMLLVAAVAAGVLLQTAGSLQQRALVTGSQTRAEISTNVRIIEVSALDASDDSAVNNFTMQLKLAPGSDPIKLSEVTLTFSSFNHTLTLAYNQTENYTTGYASDIVASTGSFTGEYLINGSNHLDGNLQRGDVLRIRFNSGRAIEEDEQLRINFIPKIGTATLVEFTTPDVMSTQTVFLYP